MRITAQSFVQTAQLSKQPLASTVIEDKKVSTANKYRIEVPEIELEVFPPNESSNTLTDKFLYCIKDCSIIWQGKALKFDFYFAKEVLTLEDRIPAETNINSTLCQQLDNDRKISNQVPANHLLVSLGRLIEHSINYEDVEKQLEAITALENAASNGKKIVFVSSHGISTQEEGWGLDLHNVPFLLPVNYILSEISMRYSQYDTALIYINSCNHQNIAPDMLNTRQPIKLPVIAHTDVNGPSYSPVELHQPV